MIIKGLQRKGGPDLAPHLTNAEENEKIIVSGGRYLSLQGPQPVHHALLVMEGVSKSSTRCQKHLYHVSINPALPMTESQWAFAWQVFEGEYGLQHQPYLEVTHEKEGRLHKHRVYERIKEDGRAISFSFDKMRNEKISRLIEYEFGHDYIHGKHAKSVISHLKKEGWEQAANWVAANYEKHQEQAPPRARMTHIEDQQQKRTKISISQVEEELRAIYAKTSNGWDFERTISELGYILTIKGTRQRWTVVDRAGGQHPVTRRLGLTTKVLKEKWSDLNPDLFMRTEEAQRLIKLSTKNIEEDTKPLASLYLELEDLHSMLSRLQHLEELRQHEEAKRIRQMKIQQDSGKE